MLHSHKARRRVSAFFMVSGTVGLAYVALFTANVDAPSAKAEVAATPTGLLAPALDSSPLPGNQENAAANTCSTQNWPFYSNECLRGDGVARPLRQVHLQPVSATLLAAPDMVRQADMTKAESLESHQYIEKPRRRNLREARHLVRHKPRPVQSRLAETRESDQTLAFSW